MNLDGISPFCAKEEIELSVGSLDRNRDINFFEKIFSKSSENNNQTILEPSQPFYPWSSLVEGDEQLDTPKSQTCME